MNIGDPFTHNGIDYTVTVVVSPARVKAIGTIPGTDDTTSGPRRIPQKIEINIADISG